MGTKAKVRHKQRTRLKSSTRVRRPWKPEWGPPIIGWTRNFIRENKWRCDPILEVDDLMQDAYLVFDKVASCYPFISEPKHFMAVFKMCLRNDFFDKARKEDKRIFKEDAPPIIEFQSTYGPDVTLNDGPLAVIYKQVPELKMVIDLFDDPSKLEELRKPLREKRGEPRENLNQRLLRLIGPQHKTDLVTSIKNLLTA